MNTKICFVILMLNFFLNTTALATELPYTTKLLNDCLKEFGYSYEGYRDGIFYFMRPGTIAAVTLDRNGFISKGVITMESQRNFRVAFGALYALYTVIQLNMGKRQVLDKKLMESKMNNLLDAISSSLRNVPEIQFRFDDLLVKAKKNDEDHSVLILLKPYW